MRIHISGTLPLGYALNRNPKPYNFESQERFESLEQIYES